MVPPETLDMLMDRGWPALERIDVDGWVVRRSHGVSLRANSVRPVRAPADTAGAFDLVEKYYSEQRTGAAFQVTPAAMPAGLDTALARRGYDRVQPTLIQVADIGEVLTRLEAAPPSPAVRIARHPGGPWLEAWWRADQRPGGVEARSFARSILTGVPALYAGLPDAAGTTMAVARLALVEPWAGLYCLGVVPEHRGRGHAATLIAALLHRAAELGLTRAWLQVLEGNHAARRLYERIGFTTAARYHYRTRTP